MYSCDIVLATNYLLKGEFIFMLRILRTVGHICLDNRLFIKSVKHHLSQDELQIGQTKYILEKKCIVVVGKL